MTALSWPSRSAVGEIIIEGELSPAGKALQLIAMGSPTAAAFAPLIVEAFEKSSHFPLMPRLLDVLDSYSREGQAEASAVSGAFDLALDLPSGTRWRDSIAVAQEQLRSRLDKSPETVSRSIGWYHYPPGLALNVPLTATSKAEWPMGVFAARLSRVLENQLPAGDRREYVRDAFGAFLAEDCESFLGGTVVATCRTVGLWPMKYQVLALAFGGFGSDGADPSIATIYLSQDPGTLDQVLDRAMLIHPGGFYRQIGILRKWRQRSPSRWEVWADLEPRLY